MQQWITQVFSRDIHFLLSLGVFTVTYLALAVGRIPGLRIDRAGIALVGATAMLLCGSISFHDAVQSVDGDTIALLFGMMIVVASLEISGFFRWTTAILPRLCSGRYALLAVTILLSGVLSALLVNDVVCVALTPLVVKLCLQQGHPPIPYLIGLATGSNIGSVATQTGNPQNIIIGSLSGISYLDFAIALTPIAAVGLLMNFLVISLIYRKALNQPAKQTELESVSAHSTVNSKRHLHFMWRSLLITGLTVVAFFLGYSITIVALAAASLTLMSRVRQSKFYDRVDWSLLVMFCGLFIVVRAFEMNVIHSFPLPDLQKTGVSPVLSISGLAVVLSNLVSNVPAVLLFRSIIPGLEDPQTGWLALAMSSTLSGNLTLLGSVANLIVVETARRAGIIVGFVEYLKVGVIITILTTAFGIFWLS